MTPERLQEVREAVQEADGVVILTGAGVSAESGIPTFRDPGGVWARYRPEDLATPGAFSRDPRTVWEWYDFRRRTVLACTPNPGHEAIAGLLLQRSDATLVTQNVDGLHQRALEEARAREAKPNDEPLPDILELHGNLLRVRCTVCRMRADHREPIRTEGVDTLPRCPDCGALLRPDVVWFGEMLNSATLEASFAAAASAQICLVVGTSAVVHPAAGVPVATLQAGGDLVEVNPTTTPLSGRARWTFRAPSGQVLPEILAAPV